MKEQIIILSFWSEYSECKLNYYFVMFYKFVRIGIAVIFLNILFLVYNRRFTYIMLIVNLAGS